MNMEVINEVIIMKEEAIKRYSKKRTSDIFRNLIMLGELFELRIEHDNDNNENKIFQESKRYMEKASYYLDVGISNDYLIKYHLLCSKFKIYEFTITKNIEMLHQAYEVAKEIITLKSESEKDATGFVQQIYSNLFLISKMLFDIEKKANYFHSLKQAYQQLERLDSINHFTRVEYFDTLYDYVTHEEDVLLGYDLIDMGKDLIKKCSPYQKHRVKVLIICIELVMSKDETCKQVDDIISDFVGNLGELFIMLERDNYFFSLEIDELNDCLNQSSVLLDLLREDIKHDVYMHLKGMIDQMMNKCLILITGNPDYSFAGWIDSEDDYINIVVNNKSTD